MLPQLLRLFLPSSKNISEETKQQKELQFFLKQLNKTEKHTVTQLIQAREKINYTLLPSRQFRCRIPGLAMAFLLSPLLNPQTPWLFSSNLYAEFYILRYLVCNLYKWIRRRFWFHKGFFFFFCGFGVAFSPISCFAPALLGTFYFGTLWFKNEYSLHTKNKKHGVQIFCLDLQFNLFGLIYLILNMTTF